MIGIWGMGGINKTTLAQVIYDEVSGQFESCYFLNVRDKMSEKCGEITLRKDLLSTLLNEENLCVVTQFHKNRLRYKRVLVVLDDVSDFKQFQILGIGHDSLGSGSRIIVTSRDKQVLANVKVYEVYKLEALNFDDSSQLFSLHAFRQNHLVDDFRDLSAMFLKYAKGLPIALKVLGAALHKKNKEYWESALNRLKKYPQDRKIFNVLRINFDGLDDAEKNIFLDLACFFKRYVCGDVIRILDGCYDGTADWQISNLVDKCLLTEGCFNLLWMHDLVRDMGQEIVCRECNNPAKRSRLWASEDVCRVLKGNMGTESMVGISFNMHQMKEAFHMCPAAFEKMVKLRFLRFQYGRNILLLPKQNLTFLPDALRYFHWDDSPLKSLPSNFSPNNLFELRLPNSNIKQLWNGNQDVVNLRLLDLKGCKNLRKIPKLSGAIKLVKLECNGCESLVKLPCMKHLTSLKSLDLSDCPITKFPEIATNGVLEELWLDGTQIEEVPLFIRSLENLEVLSMRGTKIQSIPRLDALLLDISGCPNLTELNWIEEAPSSGLQCLSRLFVENCKSLKSLLGLPLSLESLEAKNCTSLERVSFRDKDLEENHRESEIIFDFRKCCNLNQDACNNIIAAYHMISPLETKYFAKSLADTDLDDFWNPMGDPIGASCYLPRSEIPDKFENQSRNYLITMKLGSGTGKRFLCFTLCLLLNYKDLSSYKSYDIHCKYKLKGIRGAKIFRRTFHWKYPTPCRCACEQLFCRCSYEHLFLLFGENIVHRDMQYKKASFAFRVVDDEYEVRVEKCGVHVFYVDAECSDDEDIDEEDNDFSSAENNRSCSPSGVEGDANVEQGIDEDISSHEGFDFSSVEEDIDFNSDEDTSSNEDFSMVEEDANVETDHDDPVCPSLVSFVGFGLRNLLTPLSHLGIQYRATNKKMGDTEKQDSSPNNITPNSQVRSSMTEDNANVENGHPGTSTSRLDSKRNFGSDDEGDYQPDKRTRLF